MSRLTRRAILRPAGGAKTYAEFQAHIAVLAVDGVAPWDSPITNGMIAVRTTAAAATGTMYGTTWGGTQGYQGGTSDVCRLIQHGLPSEAVFNDQIANGREMFWRQESLGGTTTVTGINRNGYLSQTLTDGGGIGNAKMIKLIYWDGTAAQQMNPSTQTGPTPYVF